MMSDMCGIDRSRIVHEASFQDAVGFVGVLPRDCVPGWYEEPRWG